MDNLQTLVEKKWTGRAESYCEAINQELACFKRQAWQNEIRGQAPPIHNRLINVLDVGTGPGFFAIIMAEMGWRVHAVDCTAEMIRHAQSNADFHGARAEFSVMDSHKLDFADNSFDLLVSRNVTWSLYNPEEAYREWHRVLRPGGHLLIFDSNWYHHQFDEEAKAKKEAAELEAETRFGVRPYVEPDPELAGVIYSTLPMGRHPRPEWDAQFLPKLGFKGIVVDGDITSRVWDEVEKTINRATPMFMIRAVKA